LIQTSAGHPGNQAALGRLIPEATCKILVERIPKSCSGAAIELGSRIRNARESFDLILIDADPIAVEPFTQFVVLHADVAVVVAKAGVTLFQDLVGVLDEIRRHPIGAMSALLNFAPNIKRVGVQRRIQDAIVALSRFAKRIRGLMGALGSRRK
jgi:hypothetical protein